MPLGGGRGCLRGRVGSFVGRGVTGVGGRTDPTVGIDRSSEAAVAYSNELAVCMMRSALLNALSLAAVGRRAVGVAYLPGCAGIFEKALQLLQPRLCEITNFRVFSKHLADDLGFALT